MLYIHNDQCKMAKRDLYKGYQNRDILYINPIVILIVTIINLF